MKKKSWVHMVPWFWFCRLKIQERTKSKTQKGKVVPNDALIGGSKMSKFCSVSCVTDLVRAKLSLFL